MPKKEAIKESEVDLIKKKLDKMYENYGIDSSGMDDGDLSRVVRYYFENKEELDSDYEESKRYSGRFDDDDMI